MKKIYIISIVILVIVLIVYLIVNDEKAIKENDLNIYFFDAGKADAILISHNNDYVMIDTATEDFSDTILSYFEKNNIKKLDYLIISHPDKDHIGSASKIVDNVTISNVIKNSYIKGSTYENKFLDSLNNKNIEPLVLGINDDYSFTVGDMKFNINTAKENYDKDESNNSSLVVGLEYKNNSFLFTGDIENARTKDFVKENSKKYDFIKMPYHGNYKKPYNDLIENVSPKYAVITSSEEEMEDEKTIDLLSKNDINYYLTRNGNITILSDGDNIRVVED